MIIKAREKVMDRKLNKGVSKLSVTIGIVGLLLVGFVAGYYANMTFSSKPQTDEEDSAWRTATIKISGSTTVLPIANACAIEFMNRYTSTTVTVSGGGSGVGYSNIIDGIVNIGMASREPKTTEIDSAKNRSIAFWLYSIALDAVCVVVNPSVADSSYPLNLTLQEVGRIFAGEYTHWDQVRSGLSHHEIYVVVREPGSGTRGTFEEYTMTPWHYNMTTGASAQGSNPAVRTAIETTQYSIGYVGFGFLSASMYTVAIARDNASQHILPTIQSITSDDIAYQYPISRSLYLVTGSRPEAGSLTDRFINFVLSPAGQQIAETSGFLKLPEFP